MIWVFTGLAVLVLALAAWVRLAPVDAGRWHVDVTTAAAPGQGGWLVRPEAGDTAAPVWSAPPEAVLSALDAVAAATPRTTRLAGGIDAGRITYVTRSALWGFPDFTTVQAVPVPEGTALAMLGRLRFGRSDLGVNRARIEGWQRAVGQALQGKGHEAR